MTTNNFLLILIVGYKDKNLLSLVKDLKQMTTTPNMTYVLDQHPLNHEKDFEGISDCVYEHKIWDDIHGPAYYRSTKVFDHMHKFSHICIISPDISVTQGWDLNLISLLDKKDVVFSGSGKSVVSQKDLFSLSINYQDSNTFNTTQIVDRNFIFAKAESFRKIVMPDFLKYAGENEYLSLAFLSAGYDIMSLPTKMYLDNKFRSIENTYHTFSLEHNYNLVIDLIHGIGLDKYKITKDGLDKFLAFHSITPSMLNRLPYSANDVNYDPYDLKMHNVDARRFLSGTKAIY